MTYIGCCKPGCRHKASMQHKHILNKERRCSVITLLETKKQRLWDLSNDIAERKFCPAPDRGLPVSLRQICQSWSAMKSRLESVKGLVFPHLSHPGSHFPYFLTFLFPPIRWWEVSVEVWHWRLHLWRWMCQGMAPLPKLRRWKVINLLLHHF